LQLKVKLKFEKFTVVRLNNMIEVKGGVYGGHDTEKPKDGGGPNLPGPDGL
jgi:hypothetical protein